MSNYYVPGSLSRQKKRKKEKKKNCNYYYSFKFDIALDFQMGK